MHPSAPGEALQMLQWTPWAFGLDRWSGGPGLVRILSSSRTAAAEAEHLVASCYENSLRADPGWPKPQTPGAMIGPLTV